MSIVSKPEPLRVDHGLRRQAIVESVLRDVFQGRLRAGQHLVTQELADRFGVSHTPVREALVALASTGFIELQPNRGAIVRHVTTREVREVCQVRRVLECEAVRRAVGQLAQEELRSLAAEFQAVLALRPPHAEHSMVRARAADSRLHDLIAASCGNAFLAHELGRLKALFRVFRDVSWEHDWKYHDLGRLTVEAQEHLAIVEALLAEDRPAAVLAMSRHIRSGIKHWGRALGK